MGTIYEKTSNYQLDPYGNNDPADLRDGYNNSMRTIDATLETESSFLTWTKFLILPSIAKAMRCHSQRRTTTRHRRLKKLFMSTSMLLPKKKTTLTGGSGFAIR